METDRHNSSVPIVERNYYHKYLPIITFLSKRLVYGISGWMARLFTIISLSHIDGGKREHGLLCDLI